MREILFRAKRVDNGEWVKGYFWRGVDHIYMIPSHVGIGYDDKIKHMSAYAVEVEPETICQYTGLTDKNGNRIWENDIVRTTKFGKDDGNGHNYAGFDVFVVKWDDGGFALFNKWRRFNLRTDEKSYEILGKVFDNPELLKGE